MSENLSNNFLINLQRQYENSRRILKFSPVIDPVSCLSLKILTEREKTWQIENETDNFPPLSRPKWVVLMSREGAFGTGFSPNQILLSRLKVSTFKRASTNSRGSTPKRSRWQGLKWCEKGMIRVIVVFNGFVKSSWYIRLVTMFSHYWWNSRVIENNFTKQRTSSKSFPQIFCTIRSRLKKASKISTSTVSRTAENLKFKRSIQKKKKLATRVEYLPLSKFSRSLVSVASGSRDVCFNWI